MSNLSNLVAPAQDAIPYKTLANGYKIPGIGMGTLALTALPQNRWQRVSITPPKPVSASLTVHRSTAMKV